MSQSNFDHITDQELLNKFYADANNQWLGILLQRYTLLLLGTCMKYLKNEEAAKDAVQQIFLKVIGEIPKYQVTYFKSWLYMIAKNHCLMQLRHKSTIGFSELIQNVNDVEETDNSLEIWQKETTLNALELCMDALNPEQKTCVSLFYLQKKTYLQISNETGYTLLQVKSFIQNGKRNLKLLLQKKLQQHS